MCYRDEVRCPAVITIDAEMKKILAQNDNHNHEPMLPIESEYLIEIHDLKNIAPDLCINEVKRRFELIYTKLDTKHGRKLISPFWKPWSSLRSTFQKIVKKSQGNTVATKATDIQLAPNLITISNDKQFLREYDNCNNSPFLLFLSDEARSCLAESQQWDFDGTFKAGNYIYSPFFFIYNKNTKLNYPLISSVNFQTNIRRHRHLQQRPYSLRSYISI